MISDEKFKKTIKKREQVLGQLDLKLKLPNWIRCYILAQEDEILID